MFKRKGNLEQLEKDSNDAFITTNIAYYAKRPSCLENVCLADFAALYTKPCKRGIKTLSDDVADMSADEDKTTMYVY